MERSDKEDNKHCERTYAENILLKIKNRNDVDWPKMYSRLPNKRVDGGGWGCQVSGGGGSYDL